MTDARATRAPGIGKVPGGLSKELERFLTALKERSEVIGGNRGDTTDRAVTHREITSLIASEIEKAIKGVAGAKSGTNVLTQTINNTLTETINNTVVQNLDTDTLLGKLEGAISEEQLTDELNERIGTLLEDGGSVLQDVEDLQADQGIVPINMVAGETITAFSLIDVDASGLGVTADPSTDARYGFLVGMAEGNANAGESFRVFTCGELSNPSWAWTPGPIFAGLSGAMTQATPTSPTFAFLQTVGVALSATRVLLRIQQPIMLAVVAADRRVTTGGDVRVTTSGQTRVIA